LPKNSDPYLMGISTTKVEIARHCNMALTQAYARLANAEHIMS